MRCSKIANKVTWGRHTYMGEIEVRGGWEKCIKIGAFCSLATHIVFNCRPQHNYKRVSTFPFRTKMLEQGEVDSFYKGGIIIGNDVWVGDGVVILDGVSIADGAVLGAHAVITKNVEPYAIVGGNPARVIKYRFTPKQIQDLLQIAWWDWSDDLIKERVNDFDDINIFIEKYK